MKSKYIDIHNMKNNWGITEYRKLLICRYNHHNNDKELDTNYLYKCIDIAFEKINDKTFYESLKKGYDNTIDEYMCILDDDDDDDDEIDKQLDLLEIRISTYEKLMFHINTRDVLSIVEKLYKKEYPNVKFIDIQ